VGQWSTIVLNSPEKRRMNIYKRHLTDNPMKKEVYYKSLYLIAALYDFILGTAFLFFYKPIFAWTGMNLPENPAYLTFCATLIAIFGIMLFMIYLTLKGSRRMIITAILIKFAYIGTTFYYYFLVGRDYVDTPFMIFAFLDFIFVILFIESLNFVKD
jgi:hypothetical protein